MIKRVSIAGRLSLIISLMVILVAALQLSFSFYLSYQDARTMLETQADRALLNLTQSLEIPLWHYDEASVKQIGNAYAAESSLVMLQITSENHQPYVDIQQPNSSELIIRSANVFYDDRLVGFVRVGLSSELLETVATRMIWGAISTILAICVTVIVGIRLVLNRFLKRPLSDMSAMANAYAENAAQILQPAIEYEEFRGLMGALKDMGEQIRKQLSDLQVSEDKFRKMADFSPYALLLVNQEMEITYINQQFEDTFGYQLSDIRKLDNWFQAAYPNSKQREALIKEAVAQFRQAYINQELVHLSERIIRCKNGERKPAESSMVFIGDLLLVHVIDMTRRKKMQELVVQTEKMASVGGLAAGMAHEINNPLSAIMQGAQNTIRRLSSELQKNRTVADKYGIDLKMLSKYLEERDIYKNLEGIRESGNRAARIILNMLKFSRKSESNLAPVHIVPVLESAIELAGTEYDHREKVDFKQIRLVREYDPTLDIITCTETEIGQVILNLLINAAQAIFNSNMTEDPCITVRTKRNEETVQIEVEDNGPGMDNAIRKRVFEPFYTTKGVGKGTGLGLSVSYMIIANNHRGTMEVESTKGKGTRFVIRIPLDLPQKS